MEKLSIFLRYRAFFLFLSTVCYVQAQHTYTQGQECAVPNPCKYADQCILKPPGHVCSCRLIHLTSDGTQWKQNYTQCSNDYSPWGTNPWEDGKVVPFPAYDYERVPEFSFTSDGDYQGVYLARYARLNSNENLKGGWCAPTDNFDYSLLLDLGNISTVSAVITQGRGGVNINFLVKEFKLEWSIDNATYNMLMDGASPKLFPGNTGNDAKVYNFIDPHLYARYLRFTPTDFENMKCMRIEILGKKEVNECVNGWHRCDAKATCTDTVDAYYCTCPVGYFDALGNGFVCMQINECIDPRPYFRHNCSALATCLDLDGSFQCTCNAGQWSYLLV